MTTPLKLFYSYSHKDEPLREELETHLKLLRRQGLLESWHDRAITAGTEWAGAIDENLERSDVILLLVSANFLASDYCFDKELARAMERHETRDARVIPIALKPCDWSGTPFSRLQALPRNARPITTWPIQDEAWTDVAKGIRRVLEELDAQRTGSPTVPGTLPAPLPARLDAAPAIRTPVATTPTGVSLRRLMGAVLRSDSDLDAFCLDYFRGTYKRFAGGMDRLQKTSLVLMFEDPNAILAALRDHDPAAVVKHEGLLRFE